MNFNTLVSLILNESNTHGIPVLDDKPEVYVSYVSMYGDWSPNVTRGYTPLHRINFETAHPAWKKWVFDHTFHDDDIGIYSYDSLQETLTKIQTILNNVSRQLNLPHIKDSLQLFKNDFEPLENIASKQWFVIINDDYGHVVLGVEVDVDAYNTAKQAADDLKDF
jgi:hypothetical protein